MCRVIKVIYGIYPAEYDSISEATKVAVKFSNSRKSKRDLINGKIVVDYEYDGISLIISFDNKKYLIVSPGESSIYWNVVSNKPSIKNKLKEEDVFFEFPDKKKVLWNWKAILDGFIGKQVAISPSEQYLFIFARDEEEYIFSVLIEKENPENRYLFISEA